MIPRQRDLIEQKAARHAVIAVGMVGRYAAVVDPENPKTLPGNSRAKRPGRIGKQRKNRLGTISAGDSDTRYAARGNS